MPVSPELPVRQLNRGDQLGLDRGQGTGYDATDRDTSLPGINLVATLLKRWLAGTVPGRVSNDPPYYLDEYIFGSTGAPPARVACCYTDSGGKPWPPTRIPCMSCYVREIGGW
jgi:hypothetical protein